MQELSWARIPKQGVEDFREPVDGASSLEEPRLVASKLGGGHALGVVPYGSELRGLRDTAKGLPAGVPAVVFGLVILFGLV